MAKKNYVILLTGSYGKRGELVELDLGKDGLSDRQALMLKEYEKPVAKADESKQLKELTESNEELVKKVEALELANKELTEANSALTKTK